MNIKVTAFTVSEKFINTMYKKLHFEAGAKFWSLLKSILLINP